MSSPPTACYIVESAVINAPYSKVWHLIKLGSFSQWWSALESSKPVKSTSDEVDVFEWKFKDGSVYQVKQEEHSSIEHFITYSVVSAEPATSYSSVVSKIQLYPVTSGSAEGSTFITWTGTFSSDADAGVIADGRFKRAEALADLAKAVSA